MSSATTMYDRMMQLYKHILYLFMWTPRFTAPCTSKQGFKHHVSVTRGYWQFARVGRPKPKLGKQQRNFLPLPSDWNFQGCWLT